MNSIIKELIRLRTLELVNRPINKRSVLAILSVEFIAATKDDYHETLDNMIKRQQLIELDYEIGSIEGNILFPINTNLHLKVNKKIHNFEVRNPVDSVDTKEIL